MARYEVPEKLVTDRGRQFESATFRSLSCILCTCRLEKAAYHSQADGLVRRFHRQLKAFLKAHEAPIRWVVLLPAVLLGFHFAVQEEIECAPSQLVFSTTLLASRIRRRL